MFCLPRLHYQCYCTSFHLSSLCLITCGTHCFYDGLRERLHPFMAHCESGGEACAHAPTFSANEIYKAEPCGYSRLYDSDKKSKHMHVSGFVHTQSFTYESTQSCFSFCGIWPQVVAQVETFSTCRDLYLSRGSHILILPPRSHGHILFNLSVHFVLPLKFTLPSECAHFLSNQISTKYQFVSGLYTELMLLVLASCKINISTT